MPFAFEFILKLGIDLLYHLEQLRLGFLTHLNDISWYFLLHLQAAMQSIQLSFDFFGDLCC